MINRANDVIIALDYPNIDKTLAFLDNFTQTNRLDNGDESDTTNTPEHSLPYVKIGMELFYSEGPNAVRSVFSRGMNIFLDLKVCDIPNTARGAMRSLANLPISMVNVHALGGFEMMKMARQGLREGRENPPLLIAVTILTSIDKNILNNELGIAGDVQDAAGKLAVIAKEAGLDGVVCAPGEAARVHELCGNDFITVTPGVRFADADAGDQRRVVDPAQARAMGSDYIVVGRPITSAADPVETYQRYSKAFCGLGE